MRNSSTFLGFIILVPILLVGGVGCQVAYYQTGEDVTFTVSSKERITESSGSGETLSVSSKYLVFTDVETFENTDLFFIGKFNASDVQGKLQVDSTYTMKVYGWRVPFLSMYRSVGKL
jgi:hypothetical protein